MDWFDTGMARMKKSLAANAGLTLEQFNAAYSEIYNEGIIDYDVEKEIIFEQWLTDEERDAV